MTPRWLNDLVRIYAICVGSLTLLSIGVFLATWTLPFLGLQGHRMVQACVERSAMISVIGAWILLYVGGLVYLGCHFRDTKPPVLLVRCWVFVVFLAVCGCMGFPAVQMAR